MNIKNTIKLFSIMMIVFTTVICRTLPPVPPSGSQSSAIVVDVKLKNTVLFITGTEYPEKLYFVKLEDFNGGAAPKNYKPKAIPVESYPTEWLESTYSVKNRSYLLNASPGRYAIVAAWYKKQSQNQGSSANVGGGLSVGVSGSSVTSYTTYFPASFVQNHVILVEPGKLTVVGKANFKMSKSDEENSDALQKKYILHRKPDYFTQSGFFRLFSSDLHYVTEEANFDNSAEAIAEVKGDTKEDFAETQWSSLAE